MPRALAKSVNEKAALQALNGGSLEDVIRVRGARQHNLKTSTSRSPVTSWWPSPG